MCLVSTSAGMCWTRVPALFWYSLCDFFLHRPICFNCDDLLDYNYVILVVRFFVLEFRT